MKKVLVFIFRHFSATDSNPRTSKMAKTNTNPVSEFASGLEGVPKFPKTKTKKKRPKGKSQK